MLKTGLIASVCGLAGVTSLAQLDSIIDAGGRVAAAGGAGILGIMTIAFAIAMVKMYNKQQSDNKEHIDTLITLVSSNIKVNTELSERMKNNNGILIEFKDVIAACREKN